MESTAMILTIRCPGGPISARPDRGALELVRRTSAPRPNSEGRNGHGSAYDYLAPVRAPPPRRRLPAARLVPQSLRPEPCARRDAARPVFRADVVDLPMPTSGTAACA